MAPQNSSLVFLQYLTTVFDALDEAIFLLAVEPDNAFRLLTANEGFSRGTGHSTKDIGKTVQKIVSAESYKKLLPRYQKVVKTKKPLKFTEWYSVPLGKQFYEVKLIPIFNAVGECVQIACITRNVTEVHNLQQQLKETAETLEQLTFNMRNK
ncbi:MAG TPA: PAS domain-containing protein [Patescibacteria group bacterium]|nr:PAS domain-containing protein [Patescibacteria group bacterium]